MLDELLSAIGYVGSSLDKLGPRELRGALGGKPRELLSFIPFSDRLGITDEKDIQSGRDLLHNAGLVDRNKSGWGPALAGFATEAALDPFTLAGGAGLAKRAIGSAARGTQNVNRLRGLLNVETDAAKLAELAASRPGQQGLNRGNYVAAWAGGPEVLNEEINHGLTKMAALTGDSAGLPLQSKLAASLYRSGAQKQSPFRLGLADMFTESAGHTARKEGLGGLMEGAKYWLDPAAHRGYHGQIARYSPAAASVYHSAPGAVIGGAGGAAAGAASDQEDPIRGALLGGLAGAAGGGLTSHAFYKPKSPATAAVLGENASLGLKYDPPEPVKFDRAAWAREHPNPTPQDRERLLAELIKEQQSADQYKKITPARFGLSRSDPEWINNRTFYHGTAASDLSPQSLDINKVKGDSLFGPGIYTTDEGGRRGNKITTGYAIARASALESALRANYGSRSMLTDALRKGDLSIEDLLAAIDLGGSSSRRLASRLSTMADPESIVAARSEAYVRNLLHDLDNDVIPSGDVRRDVAGRIASGLDRQVEVQPTIYQAQSEFDKILDLDQPSPEVAERIARHPTWDFSLTPGDLESPIGPLVRTVQSTGDEDAFALANLLRGDLGYDAMTHTGGGRWTPGDQPHQVVIALNPQKYRRFEQLPQDELARILGGENAAMDPRFRPFQGQGRELQDAADYIGPGYAPDRTITEAFGGDLPTHHLMTAMLERLTPEDLGRIIQEIPPGSKPLGRGEEALALKTPGPNPWAIRIGPEVSPLYASEQARVNLPEVVQPFRSNLIGGQQHNRVSVEHVPLINTITNLDDVGRLVSDLRSTRDMKLGDLAGDLEFEHSGNIDRWLSLGSELADRLALRGHDRVADVSENVSNFGWWNDPKRGLVAGVHDPGAVRPMQGTLIPYPYTPGRPSPDLYAQALNMGSRDAIREALQRGAAEGLQGQGVSIPGVLDRAVQSDRSIRDLYNKAFAELMMYRAENAGVDAPWLRF